MNDFETMKTIIEKSGIEYSAEELSTSTLEKFYGDAHRYANGYPTTYNQKIYIPDHPFYTEMLFKDGELLNIEVGE